MHRHLILAAHGSESRAGRAAMTKFVTAVRRATRNTVHEAFLDVEEPLIDEVVTNLRGPRSVIPLVLLSETTRASLTAEVRQDPLVTVAPALGPDWAIAEVLVQRLIEAGAVNTDTIVLATDVIADDKAVREVGRAAQLLSAVWGGPVHVGALGGIETPLETAIDIARAHGKRVVLAAYALTEGAVWEAFCRSDADVVTAPMLGDGPTDPRLVHLVFERVASVESGVVGA